MMSDDQLDLLDFGDVAPPWIPTTPRGRKPASEYELFLALRPDFARDATLRSEVELLQQRYRSPMSKLRMPSLWHVTLLELGKFKDSYPREALDAIEAACGSVVSRFLPVAHEGLVSFKASDASVLTCSATTKQAVTLLRQELVAALRSRSIKYKMGSDPHMTLFYDSEHHLEPTPLDEPLRWTADGFSLLCSHKGLSHHELVRHWPVLS